MNTAGRGIVTSSDVMKQIVGNIDDDEYIQSEDSKVISLGRNRFLIDGLLPVSELVQLIGFEPEETEECETAAGLLLTIFDRIPDEGDRVSIENKNTKVTFIINRMERHRIDKIRIKIEKQQEQEPAEDKVS